MQKEVHQDEESIFVKGMENFQDRSSNTKEILKDVSPGVYY